MANQESPASWAPRIVVFSIEDCRHCRGAKALLEGLGLEYEDISLTKYPEKRADMLQLADRLTVPQVFIHGRHIGGAAELEAVHKSGRLPELLDAEATELAHDPKLRRPAYAPRPPELVPEAPPEPTVCIGGQCLEYSSLVEVLLQGVEVRDHSRWLGLVRAKQCFQGSQLVELLQRRFQLKSREEALQASRQLLRSGVFSSVDGSSGYFVEHGLFRFQAHATGLRTALNVARKWCSPDGCISDAMGNPIGLLNRLKGQLRQLLSAHTSADGMVDYVSMAEDRAFQQYDLAVGELQLVHLANMEPTYRRAFVINLYNAMVPHAFAKLGIPSHDLARGAFFDLASYELGGEGGTEAYSFSDLENGVLRGNRTPPYHLRRPFRPGSPKLGSVLPCDHRIHFALNCGAKSCPPVRSLNPGSLDEELRVVAMAWAEQEDNIRVDTESQTLWLSRICQWYSEDFGADKVRIATTLLEHLRGDKREQVQALIKSGFTLKHVPYDWSTNSQRAQQLSEVCLTCFL